MESHFDGPRFADWLSRTMKARGLSTRELAARIGVSYNTLAIMVRGAPTETDRRKGSTGQNPSVNMLYSLAVGLDLDFSYLLTQAGLRDKGMRFTERERRALARTFSCDPEGVDFALADAAAAEQ